MPTAKDTQLSAIAKATRQAVKRWTKGNPDVDQRDMTGACGIATYSLYVTLRMAGHRCCVVTAQDPLGHGHCWLEMGSKVIDVTATQIPGCSYPKVLIVDKREYENVLINFFFGKARLSTVTRHRSTRAIEDLRSEFLESPVRYRDQIYSFSRCLLIAMRITPKAIAHKL